MRKKSDDISVFWVHANSVESFRRDYATIASVARLPGINDPAIDILGLVKAYLEDQRSGPWTMIIDNADDRDVLCGKVEEMGPDGQGHFISLDEFIPTRTRANVIITSRNKQLALELAVTGPLLFVPEMSPTDAISLFQSRMRSSVALADEIEEINEMVKLLDFLPLAITQAAALIEYESISISEYTARFRSELEAPADMLDKDFMDPGRSREGANAVYRTWAISFRQIQRSNPEATDLLSLMSFYEDKSIPEWLFHPSCMSSTRFRDALGVLKGYCFLSTGADSKGLNLHRLCRICVQLWLKRNNCYVEFAIRSIGLMAQVFPDPRSDRWNLCAVLIPHTQALLGLSLPSQALLQRIDLEDRIAKCLDFQGEYANAERLSKSLYDARSAMFGPSHRATISALALLGVASWRRGAYAEAEKVQRKALERRETLLGPEDIDTLESCSNLQELLWDTGKYDEAEKLHRRAWKGYELKLGKDDPITLRNAATEPAYLWRHGLIFKAEQAAQTNLRQQTRVLGFDHPATIDTLNMVASLSEVLGRYKEAEDHFRTVYNARSRLLGAKHPSTFGAKSRIASLERLKGCFSCSLQHLDELIAVSEDVLGAQHPETLSHANQRTLVYLDQGAYKEAENHGRHVLEVCTKNLGSSHPCTFEAAELLVEVLLMTGTNPEALNLAKKTLQAKEVGLGKAHPSTLHSLQRHTRALVNVQKYEDALTAGRSACEQHSRSLGQKHPDTLTSMSNLALVLRDLRQYDKAEEMSRSTLLLQREVLGEKHPDALTRSTTIRRSRGDESVDPLATA
ncbi:hypothetical protein LTS17_012780 [Exophiala oligosperma]